MRVFPTHTVRAELSLLKMDDSYLDTLRLLNHVNTNRDKTPESFKFTPLPVEIIVCSDLLEGHVSDLDVDVVVEVTNGTRSLVSPLSVTAITVVTLGHATMTCKKSLQPY
jgi:hypothetical protein